MPSRATAPGFGSHSSQQVVRRPTEYEDFQPRWELTDDQDAHTLILTLPNFRKEQIWVAVDPELHFLNIEGQHLVEAANKWARFSHAFRIPDNCSLDQIRAFFENGRLSVMMPKVERTSQAEPKHENRPNQEAKLSPSPEKKPPPCEEGPAPTVSQHPSLPPPELSAIPAALGEKQMDGTSSMSAATEGAGKDKTDKNSGDAAKRIMDRKKAAKAAAAAAGPEDRWLLVNAGAAALVLVAFGAYLSSSLWAYGKQEN